MQILVQLLTIQRFLLVLNLFKLQILVLLRVFILDAAQQSLWVSRTQFGVIVWLQIANVFVKLFIQERKHVVH